MIHPPTYCVRKKLTYGSSQRLTCLKNCKSRQLQDSDLGKHSGAFYSLANKPAAVKVKILADNLVIVNARHWLIHLQSE